jgi:hypothetical protein
VKADVWKGTADLAGVSERFNDGNLPDWLVNTFFSK